MYDPTVSIWFEMNLKLAIPVKFYSERLSFKDEALRTLGLFSSKPRCSIALLS